MVLTVTDTALFLLKHLVFISALCLTSYLLGRRVTPRFVWHSLAEKAVFSIGLGLGLMSGLVFLAGITGHLRSSLLAFGIALIILTSFGVGGELWDDLKLVYRRAVEQPRKMRLWVVFAMLLVPAAILALYPPTAFDATMSHLPLVKQYLRDGQISPAPFLRWSVLPQIQHMLFALGMLLCDDIAPQLIQFLMTLLTGFSLYSWGARHFTPGMGLWAAALWLAHPMVIFVGTAAYIDIGLTFFLLLASYALFNWIAEGGDNWLLLAAIFSGFAAGSKYAALFFLGIFGLIILWQAIRCRRWSPPFGYAVIAAGVAAPWYLYNYYHTGNPVFPFMAEVFGYSFWSQSDLNAQMIELNTHGLGRSLQSLIWLPLNLAVYQQKFLLEAPYLPFHLLGMPFIILGLRYGRVRYLVFLVLAYVLFWFNSAQVLRYLLPVVPHLSLAIATATGLVLGRLSLPERFARRDTWALILLVLTLLPGTAYAIIKVHIQGHLPVSHETRERYLSTQLIQYPAFSYLNEQRRQEYTLYAFQAPRMAYYADGNFRGDWFGEARFPGILDETSVAVKIKEGQGLYDKLRSLDVTHLLITSPYSRIDISDDTPYRSHLLKFIELLKMDNSLRTRRLARFEAPTDQFFQSHFKLVYARAYVRLYELNETPFDPEPGAEQLMNSGFETVGSSPAVFWDSGPSSATQNGGPTSSVAVRCADAVACIAQTVQIDEGQTYRLSNQARALNNGTEMILGVSWIDREGRQIATDREYFQVGVDWQSYEIAATAPPLAVAARIETGADQASPLLVDDYSFTRPRYRQ